MQVTSAAPVLTIGFVLLRQFTLLPFAAFVDCLRLASDEGDRSRQLQCRWSFMTTDGRDAIASCGASITPCIPLCEPEVFDYIVVIGGIQDVQNNADQRTLAYLRHAANVSIPLVGVCTGVFSLIQAGLLDGKRCCISWYHYSDLVCRFPAVTPVADRLFIDDGNLITCAGGIASVDLAAYLVERHLGRSWAMKSLHILLIDEVRRGDHPQPQPIVTDRIADRTVWRAVNIISQHMGDAITVEELARRLNTSRRNIERKFRDELGIPPQRFARNLRLRYGLWLLQYTGKSVTEIGDRCGFADTAHFSRNFRETFGYPPSAVRKTDNNSEGHQADSSFSHAVNKTFSSGAS